MQEMLCPFPFSALTSSDIQEIAQQPHSRFRANIDGSHKGDDVGCQKLQRRENQLRHMG